MNSLTHRIRPWAALCGPAAVVISFAGWLVAGVLPIPLGPGSSEGEVVEFYSHDVRVLTGLVIASFGVSLVLPFVAAVTLELLEIEGRTPLLSFLQLASGAATSVLLLIPMLLMAFLSFRPDRSPELTVTLNDLAWLLFLTPIVPFIIQDVAIGLAILGDPQQRLPRWLGYLNLWVAFCFLPDPLAFFFHTGPLAWNGVLVFWLALTAYAVWLVVVGVVIYRRHRGPAVTAVPNAA